MYTRNGKRLIGLLWIREPYIGMFSHYLGKNKRTKHHVFLGFQYPVIGAEYGQFSYLHDRYITASNKKLFVRIYVDKNGKTDIIEKRNKYLTNLEDSK